MPTVPRYEEQQVATAPIAGNRFPTSLPEGAAGVAPRVDISGLGNAIEQVHQKEMQKANQVVLTGAEAKAAQLETQLLYDPEKGVMNLKGKNALNGQQVLDDGWKQGMDDIAKDLHNDEQRRIFTNMAALRYSQINNTLKRHVAEQLTQESYQSSVSLIENERKAVTAAAIPGVKLEDIADRTTMGIARQRAAIADLAKSQGWSPERTARALDETTSATHLAVLEQIAANKDDLTAKKYFDEMKSYLSGDDLKKATVLVKESSVRGESQRLSDAILTKFGDNRQAAYNAAKKITDPELRDAAQTRIVHEFEVKDAIERDQQEKDYLTAKNIVAANPGSMARDVIPADLWKRLPLGAVNALERFSGDRETDPKVWHGFLELTPQQLGKLNQQEFESQYWSHFDNATRTRADLMWAAARDGVRTGKFDPKTSSDETFKDIVNLSLRRSNMIPRNKAPKDLTQSQYQFYADFTLEAMRRKEAAEQAKGKPLSGTEVQDIVDKLTLQRVFVDDHWLGKDTQRLPSTIARDERKRAYVPYDEIPTAERSAVEQLVKSARKSSTRKKIERLYAARVLNDRQLWDDIMKER